MSQLFTAGGRNIGASASVLLMIIHSGSPLGLTGLISFQSKEILMLGKSEGRRRKGQQRMRWLDGIIDSVDMVMRKLREIVKDKEAGMLQSMGLQRVKYNLVLKKQQICISPLFFFLDFLLI